MSNTLVTPTIVAKESLLQLKNNMVMGNIVFRGHEKEWQSTVNGYKKGQTITVSCPMVARVQDGATINTVDFNERSTTFTLGFRKHVAHKLTTDEMTYNIDGWTEKIIKPAMSALANYVDQTLLNLYKYIPNQVGTPGTTPSTFLTFALANAILNNHAAPMDDRHVVVDPMCQAYISDTLKGLFQPAMVGTAVQKAQFAPQIAGLVPYMSQNVNSHTCGTAAGLTTNLVDDTVAEGDTGINVDQNGSWSGTFTLGDIFSIANVYGVNPITGESTGQLRQFVVDAAASGDATDCPLTCTPGTSPYQMYSASASDTYLPYQNMNALPVNNAAVTVEGTASLVHKVNLAFHRNCLGLAMVPLRKPDSANWCEQMTEEGYSVRVWKFADGMNDAEYVRFDILFGVKALNPFLGVRIAG